MPVVAPKVKVVRVGNINRISDVSIVDLGMVNYQDVVSAPNGYIELLPYQPGKFINRIFFSSHGFIPFTGDADVFFWTPNTAANSSGNKGYGFANFFGPTFDPITDTIGNVKSDSATGLSNSGLAVPAGNVVFDCGPLILSNDVNTFLEPLQTWAPNKKYARLEFVLDSNGFIQVVFTNGTSGGTEPVWDDTPNATTNDGTVVWQTYAAKPSDCTGRIHAFAEILNIPDHFIQYAANMEFVQQPTNVVSGNPFNPDVTVQILDQLGDPFTLQQLNVELDIVGDGSLDSTVVVSDNTGLCTFTGLTFTGDASAGRVLIARIYSFGVPYFKVTSDPFNVT